MKSIFAFGMCLIALASFTACGGGGASEPIAPTGSTVAAPQDGVQPILPEPGNGAGGASGPVLLTSLAAVRRASSLQFLRTSDEKKDGLEVHQEAVPDPYYHGPISPEQLRSEDASFTEADVSSRAPAGLQPERHRATPSPAPTATPSAPPGGRAITNIVSVSDQDIGGAASDQYILTTGVGSVIGIYNLQGVSVLSVNTNAFFCTPPSAATQPLPLCSTVPGGGSAMDLRSFYDTVAQRWAIVAMWGGIGPGPNPGQGQPAMMALAVSQSSNPTGGWYLYQFQDCGPNTQGQPDLWPNDYGDQPHFGFSSQWIVVQANCSADFYPLTVLDKTQLYAGKPLALNGNYFKFKDPVTSGNLNGNGTSDDGKPPHGGLKNDPVQTYATAPQNRQYLAVQGLDSKGNTEMVYSYIQGTVDAPRYYPSVSTADTSLNIFGGTWQNFNAPGCTSCIQGLEYDGLNSAGLYALKNGDSVLLSTVAEPDGRHQPSSQIIGVANDLTKKKVTAISLSTGTAGDGFLGSEITMPLISATSSNIAVLAYDKVGATFYPGVGDMDWNLDTNSIGSLTTLMEGDETPTPGGYEANRFIDFLDASTPVPGSSNVFFGGEVAHVFAGSPSAPRSTYYGIITP
jgi:hypothetical protein